MKPPRNRFDELARIIEHLEQRAAENERARLVALLRKAGARMAYHVADDIERGVAS